MWRNGYAPVCKTVYSGSIPDVASKHSFSIDRSSSQLALLRACAGFVRPTSPHFEITLPDRACPGLLTTFGCA
jgi:hypothetical protein